MPFYHGTFRENLASIRRLGLRAGVTKAFDGVPDGVYLAENPLYSLCVLLEHYTTFGDPKSVPAERLKDFCVIVVDDARINRANLRPDPNVPDVQGMWLYDGVIDITSLPILSVNDIVNTEVR